MQCTGRTKHLRAPAQAEASHGQRVDRISPLPEDLILRVMSHLNARQAVQTCLLSRLWRHLWRSVPIINASVDEFDSMGDITSECLVLFKKFVNRLLMLRNPVGLDEFRLVYSLLSEDDSVAGSADANLWICHALQCNAHAISIVSRLCYLVPIPSVFTSTFLKRLHICYAFLRHGFFRQLQGGCPELEYLCLLDCLIEDVEISFNTLKALVLDCGVLFVDPDRLSISAPRLISLSCHRLWVARLPSLMNMASLERASVSLLKNYNVDFDADGLCLLLKSLSGVTTLDFFYGHINLIMEKKHQWCPVFSKLVNLTLHEWCLHKDFYALIVFLQNSPCLKKLTLKLVKQVNSSAIIGELEERLFTCEQLESVEIICTVNYPQPEISRVEQVFIDSGITSTQIHIHRQTYARPHDFSCSPLES